MVVVVWCGASSLLSVSPCAASEPSSKWQLACELPPKKDINREHEHRERKSGGWANVRACCGACFCAGFVFVVCVGCSLSILHIPPPLVWTHGWGACVTVDPPALSCWCSTLERICCCLIVGGLSCSCVTLDYYLYPCNHAQLRASRSCVPEGHQEGW